MTNPISINMVNALNVQSELFSLVKNFAPQCTQEILGKQSISQQNFWRTIRYRAILLTFDVNEPENHRKYPYGWHIYFDKPTILFFSQKPSGSEKWKRQLSLDLEREFYFQLLKDEKRKLIEGFVRESIEFIKLNPA